MQRRAVDKLVGGVAVLPLHEGESGSAPHAAVGRGEAELEAAVWWLAASPEVSTPRAESASPAASMLPSVRSTAGVSGWKTLRCEGRSMQSSNPPNACNAPSCTAGAACARQGSIPKSPPSPPPPRLSSV